MPFLYGAAYINETLVSYHSLLNEPCDGIISVFVGAVDPNSQLSIFSLPDHRIYGVVCKDKTFVCIATSDISDSLALFFLEEMNRIFLQRFGPKATKIPKQAFKTGISYLISKFNDENKVKIEEIRSKISNRDPITAKVLEISVDINPDLTEAQPEELSPRESCWQRQKWILVSIICFLLFLYVLLVAACGGLDLRPRCL